MANDPVFQIGTDLTDAIQLYVHLVTGERGAVWIDSGVKPIFGDMVRTMDRAGVGPDDLRLILHTHSHHDHMGCNAQLQDWAGRCLIAAPARYAVWHADFERHYQEFARPFPGLIPDTPELRAEVMDILDEPRPLDMHVDEGFAFDLGGGVVLEAVSLPGHMLAELGYVERSSRTLILGDAITALDWPVFHSHLSVEGYRHSLDRIARVMEESGIERVCTGHFATMAASEVPPLLAKARDYIDGVEATIIRVLAGTPVVSLETLWRETCERWGRITEFRALNMVHAHVRDLESRGILREVEPARYELR